MIICKGAGPSRWSFAKGRSILMIICKRLIHQDDHLQKAGPSRWSFVKRRLIKMVTCKRLVHLDDHLQEAGPSDPWSFAFMVSCCLSLVIVCCLSFVVVCPLMLFVVCSWSLFVDCCFSPFLAPLVHLKHNLVHFQSQLVNLVYLLC